MARRKIGSGSALWGRPASETFSGMSGGRASAELQYWTQRSWGCVPAAAGRSLATAPPPGVSASVLAKARRMSPSVGLLAGAFGSVVGVGGGVIIVPAIVTACKTIPQRLVSGTSLVAVLSTALASAGTYGASGYVDATAALLIAPAAMMTAPLGARLTLKLNCQALRRALGIFLCCVAPLVPLKVPLSCPRHSSGSGLGACKAPLLLYLIGFPPFPYMQAYLLSRAEAAPAADLDSGGGPAAAAVAAPPPGGGGNGSPAEEAAPAAPSFSLEALQGLISQQAEAVAAMGPVAAAALVTTGAAAGLASGLLGIGGGTLVTPILALLPMAYSQATVVGTSLAAMIPPSAVALAQHHRLGNVDWRMAAGLAIGTAVGGTLGSAAAVQLPTGEPAGCLSLVRVTSSGLS